MDEEKRVLAERVIDEIAAAGRTYSEVRLTGVETNALQEWLVWAEREITLLAEG